ncbi:MAG TPA: branched-chain amino acid ABC transporter permease [Dehalococcoidia bacterium]|nr:branched-chain amino acid ABC transporter permease [Dehalococcoidia bacterium]
MNVKSKLTKTVGLASLVVLLFLLPLFIKQPYYLHIFIITLIYIIVVSSLRTVALSGQVSVGHAAFMGIGAYFSGVISKELGLNPWLAIPLGGLASMTIAVLVGYPFTRVRAIYFSMVSLFGGIVIVNIIRVAQKWTGAAGLAGIPPLSPINIHGLINITFLGQKVPYYYFTLLLTLVCLLVLYRIEHCRIGMTLKGIAQSHLVASSVGINEAGFRVLALAVGCFFAGIAGAWYAHYNLVLTPPTFGFLPSIFLVMYMLVGGHDRFAGPIVGTAILVMVPEIFRGLKEYAPLILGAIMVIVVFLMPQGIAGLFDQIKAKYGQVRNRKGSRSAA